MCESVARTTIRKGMKMRDAEGEVAVTNFLCMVANAWTLFAAKVHYRNWSSCCIGIRTNLGWTNFDIFWLPARWTLIGTSRRNEYVQQKEKILLCDFSYRYCFSIDLGSRIKIFWLTVIFAKVILNRLLLFVGVIKKLNVQREMWTRLHSEIISRLARVEVIF